MKELNPKHPGQLTGSADDVVLLEKLHRAVDATDIVIDHFPPNTRANAENKKRGGGGRKRFSPKSSLHQMYYPHRKLELIIKGNTWTMQLKHFSSCLINTAK